MQTYRIIGTDQKEYGPVNGDQIRAWIAQGRVNASTRMRLEEGGDWKLLGDFPEFSREAGPRIPSIPVSQPAAATKTSGMAIASLVLGILSPLTCSVSALVGVVLGPVAMGEIQKSKGQLRGNGIALAGTIISGAFLLAIPVFAALLLPAFANAKGKAQTITCVNHLKTLSASTQIYESRNQNQFPPAQTWCDAIKTEVLSDTFFQCPAAHNGERCHYAFNAKLDGMDVRQVAPDTVMFFETDGGWNVSGGRELMLESPRHHNKYIIAYADGSVHQIDRFDLGTLRWDPARNQ
jgi:hypothetical protein